MARPSTRKRGKADGRRSEKRHPREGEGQREKRKGRGEQGARDKQNTPRRKTRKKGEERMGGGTEPMGSSADGVGRKRPANDARRKTTAGRVQKGTIEGVTKRGAPQEETREGGRREGGQTRSAGITPQSAERPSAPGTPPKAEGAQKRKGAHRPAARSDQQ